MEEYYQKVIQLQERLRQSEEERLKLEMKFNEMLQGIKEEEEAHFKKLRHKYKQFLDEDRRRQQRNDKILEALDRIENRSQIWQAKTEKFNEFRRKYHDYLKHTNGRRSRSPFDVERTPEPKDEVYEPPTVVFPDQIPKKDSGDIRSDIMEKYLQSLSSQKCKDDILQKKDTQKPPPESKYSNLGNINSIYWTPPKTSDKIDQEKEDKYDSTQLKNNKDMENALKQNYVPDHDWDRRFKEKSYDVPSFERKPLGESNYDTFSPGRKLSTDPERFPSNVSSINQNPLGNDLPRRVSQQYTDEGRALHVHNELESLIKQHKDEVQNPLLQTMNKALPLNYQPPQPGQFQPMPNKQQIPRQSIHELSTPLTQLPRQIEKGGFELKDDQMVIKKTEMSNPQSLNNQSFGRPIEGGLPREPPVQIQKEFPRQIQREPPTSIPREPPVQTQREPATQVQREPPTSITREPPSQIQRRPSEAMKSEFANITPLARTELPIAATERENKVFEQRTEKIEDKPQGPVTIDQQLDVAKQQNDGQGIGPKTQQLQDNSNVQSSQEFVDDGQYPQQYYDESGQVLQQYNENGEPLQQPYDESGPELQQYDQSGQPLQQYDETGQPLQQYDETGQPLQQYDENGQPIQSFYDETGQYYDGTGQPLQKYDENGQPLQQYYDNTGQAQYDENGQPIAQYDENGQPIMGYDPNSQIQYDENGQPIVQFDENGQPLAQYDANGQPLAQYDENGQPLAQYDANGQPLAQYDANGQPLTQYDANGQPLTQYDANGQPLPQYDANGQPLTQYDENGQPLQQYYDENGQPIQYYGEGESAQQYDENGQPIQQQYSDQPYGDGQQYYEDPAQVPKQEEVQPQVETKSNVLDMLETDTESTKQDTKVSNESDFDFSNG